MKPSHSDIYGLLCFLLVEFQQRNHTLACPFFAPTHRADDIALPHPIRLPLGAGWRGACDAPGHEHTVLSNVDLESCNLGYAKSCPRLPKDRTCDAVRFAVANDLGSTIALRFVYESNYLPAGSGTLEYDVVLRSWITKHPEPRTQKLAQAFLQAYLERKNSNPSTSQ